MSEANRGPVCPPLLPYCLLFQALINRMWPSSYSCKLRPGQWNVNGKCHSIWKLSGDNRHLSFATSSTPLSCHQECRCAGWHKSSHLGLSSVLWNKTHVEGQKDPTRGEWQTSLESTMFDRWGLLLPGRKRRQVEGRGSRKHSKVYIQSLISKRSKSPSC
jgi:hypothetical protein